MVQNQLINMSLCRFLCPIVAYPSLLRQRSLIWLTNCYHLAVESFPD